MTGYLQAPISRTVSCPKYAYIIYKEAVSNAERCSLHVGWTPMMDVDPHPTDDAPTSFFSNLSA